MTFHVQPSDEKRDPPPVTVDLVYLTGSILFVLVLVLALLLGLLGGSALLHTWDAEIRQALFWAWEQLARLYWAAMHVQG